MKIRDGIGAQQLDTDLPAHTAIFISMFPLRKGSITTWLSKHSTTSKLYHHVSHYHMALAAVLRP